MAGFNHNKNFQEKRMKSVEVRINSAYREKQSKIIETGFINKLLKQERKLEAKQRREFINRLGK